MMAESCRPMFHMSFLEVCNAVEKGILDHMETKRWAMRFTLDAVLTVLKAGLCGHGVLGTGRL